MLIEIHMIQNHSPANLNRDDLGAPKTCYFGGVLRSRISSQCMKRSVRMSAEFRALCGGIRTRQLAGLIAESVTGKADAKKRAAKILKQCGINPKDEDKSDMLVYTTNNAIAEMAELLQNDEGRSDEDLAKDFGNLISERVAVPDMALTGRMLETGVLKDTTVEAALQVAHAISTHEARPEVDYYVAADDIPGDDAGAGYVDEAMFSSACFYKYFSIHWETLVGNLKGNAELAAHTVGAFIRGAALVNPSGKQNSFAAHNPPDAILIEFKNAPISYANAFAKPVSLDQGRDIIAQSIAQLSQYVYDLETGFGKPQDRFWFSPNLRYRLSAVDENKQEIAISENNIKSLDELIPAVVAAIGFDWSAVQQAVVNPEVAV
ncbi:MAG TPA: type I-E CRISPR-associated protein Cas7/Cse4/CasC [Candidatus Hydrogenedentes bacterium]|nr:type I-E CRISPR-associated protein Cas7/Cse4/CasC [Candidatus Hydrogenedentota bacterium]HPG65203.1 type I-E CRISPR-associated protein Cas7/Cse4/CasC [Candidatus Hydrogenedentota bacterium]